MIIPKLMLLSLLQVAARSLPMVLLTSPSGDHSMMQGGSTCEEQEAEEELSIKKCVQAVKDMGKTVSSEWNMPTSSANSKRFPRGCSYRDNKKMVIFNLGTGAPNTGASPICKKKKPTDNNKPRPTPTGPSYVLKPVNQVCDKTEEFNPQTLSQCVQAVKKTGKEPASEWNMPASSKWAALYPKGCSYRENKTRRFSTRDRERLVGRRDQFVW